ncbi:MAG: histidine phosphatase family protein [Chromatiales bacterium]|nr:histidine phosphatase family protein [Chromatiales bacterium]
MTETVIDLLRHGTPVGGRLYRGQKDDPLSDKGWEQMWYAVSGETPWTRITSSPLLRCCEFATQLAEKLKLPLTIDERFAELGYGVWEGKSGSELKENDPDILKRFFYDPHNHTPEGAEPIGAFMERVSTAYDDVVTQHGGERILIVGHACVIRAVLAKTLVAPAEAIFRINVETASLTRIRENDERPPTLLFHNRDKL